MAVYERAWRRWTGASTTLRWRFLVISRYALKDVFSSRVFTVFYGFCALPAVVALLLVYVSHNLGLLEQLGLTEEVMGGFTLAFFQRLFGFQVFPAFLVAVIVSPSLISADLSHNALPLYLSRPITRRSYILGKMAVLGLLLSPVTWMASLLVFTLQSYLEGNGWWLANYRIAVAHLVGHLTWILVVSLLSLAISAWVRFKPLARGALLGVFLVLGGLAEAINGMAATDWGGVIDLGGCIVVVVESLFESGAETTLPPWAAWSALIVSCLFSLGLLHRKLQAHEVVR